MTNPLHKFVVVTRDIIAPQDIAVEKDDVGFIKSEAIHHASIFFIRIWKQVDLHRDDFELLDVKRTGDGFSKKICNVCNKLEHV